MQARAERVSTAGDAAFAVKRRRDPRFGFYWHFHPEAELTLIVRSRGRRFVGDSIEDYRDGDLVLLGPDLPHTWQSAGGTRRHEAVVVQFRPDFLGRGFLGRPEAARVRRLLERAAVGLQFTGRAQREAARSMEALERRSGLSRIAGLLELLETLARSREARPLSSPAFRPSLRRGDGRRIDRVLRFLSEAFTGPVALADAADRAHLSVPAFCRFFRRSTGKTFVDALHELRVGFACRRLIESDEPVASIAFASGFNNLSNFNRRFRALRGTSPREYRLRHSP
jgi:AraC-like DNA-binding protein